MIFRVVALDDWLASPTGRTRPRPSLRKALSRPISHCSGGSVYRKLAPWSIAVAAAPIPITGVTAAPASADAVIDPAPISPHQYFLGEVNGLTGHATIKM